MAVKPTNNTSAVDIQQISQNIDQQLANIEQEIAALENNHTTEDHKQTLATLHLAKEKLEKSQSIAWKAHKLSLEASSEVREAPFRKLGIGLILFSVIGFIVLVTYAMQ